MVIYVYLSGFLKNKKKTIQKMKLNILIYLNKKILNFRDL